MDKKVPDLVPYSGRPIMASEPHGGHSDAVAFVEDPADETGADLREALAVLRRRARLIALVTLAFAGVATYLALTREPRYHATATIRVADVRRALTGGIEEQAMERMTGALVDPVLSQLEVLRSRTLIGRAVDGHALRLQPAEFPAGLVSGISVDPMAPADTLAVRFRDADFVIRGRAGEVTGIYGQPVAIGGARFTVAERPVASQGTIYLRGRDEAIAYVAARLGARTRERTDVVDIRFEATDPAVAQRVVNAVATTFQEFNAERAQNQSRRRRAFVEHQLGMTDSLLAVAQLQLSEFREREQVYSSRDRFIAEQQGLMGIEVRLEELRADRDMYQALLTRMLQAREQRDPSAVRSLVASPGISGNTVVSSLYQQLARYEGTRDSLLSGSNPRTATDPDVQRLGALISGLETKIGEAVQSHIGGLDARAATLVQYRDRSASAIAALPDVESQEVRLAQEVQTIQGLADELRREAQRARIAEAVEAGQVEILDHAYGAVPLPRRTGLMMTIGIMFGLMVGAGGAFVLEHLNTSIRRRADVERLLRITNLAVVPQLDREGSRTSAALAAPDGVPQPDDTVVAVHQVHSSAAEAYRTLRTNLLFSQAVRAFRAIAVTSAGPAEGKSTTAANLAASFAQQGLRVLLVDCDLRRPRVHEIFATPREPGFTQLLLGTATLEDLVRATSVENLFVLPSGALPPNPAELVGSARMKPALGELRAAYDMVVMDTPPVLLASDAAIVGAAVDGVLLVLRAGATSVPAGQQALAQLEKVGANVLGAVLNDPDAKTPSYEGSYGYGSSYYTYYGSAENGSGRGKRRRLGIGSR